MLKIDGSYIGKETAMKLLEEERGGGD